MKNRFKHSLTLLILSLSVLSGSACTPAVQPNSQLADAYGTPGIVQVPAYQRTIFSSNNF